MAAGGANKGDVTHSLKDEHAPQDGNHDSMAQRLEALVEKSESQHEAHVGSAADPTLSQSKATAAGSSFTMHSLLTTLACKLPLPGGGKDLEDEFVKMKMGNYIAIRGTDQTVFETMPIYVRVGMHLLFYGSRNSSLLRWGSVENLLRKMSLREGVIYDDTSDSKAVQEFIQNFIKTYKIDTSDLLETDLTKYPSRNSFFYRKLKPDVRPIADPSNRKLITSAADCRLTVFDSAAKAKEIWIKGQKFSVHELINGVGNSVKNDMSEDSSLAIFRLAPADYHRYNHPIGPVEVVGKTHAGTEYYTVNPDAVNENFDVFTGNTRDITMFEWSPVDGGANKFRCAFVSIGALLVGSNRFTGADQGHKYDRGDEMGYFAYGGSTVIAVLPPDAKVKWDADLMANSLKGLETLVKVGERIGVSEA